MSSSASSSSVALSLFEAEDRLLEMAPALDPELEDAPDGLLCGVEVEVAFPVFRARAAEAETGALDPATLLLPLATLDLPEGLRELGGAVQT